MDTRELAAAIRDLLDVVDHDQQLIAGPLRILTTYLTESITSYLGLQVRLSHLTHPFRLASFLDAGDEHDVQTSIAIPFSALGPATQHGDITFYSGRSGAFVDLAADLTFALGVDPDVIEIIDRPMTIRISSGVDGLDEISTINRAIGVLMERGSLPDEALATLRSDAVVLGTTVYQQARAVLRSAREQRPGGPAA